jgi:ABC-2 type transport system permease protein
MNKLLACIKKEILLLVRDRVGMLILFLMPMVLIFVMTLIQDSAFKSINEKGIPIVYVNDDLDSLGSMIEFGLRNNDLCAYNDSIDGQPATPETARKAVAEGRFLVGIIVPKNATKAIRSNVIELVNETMALEEEVVDKNQVLPDSVQITIFIDPVAKKSFLTSITSNLREFISEVKTKIMFQAFSDQIAEVVPDRKNAPQNAFARTQIISYNEEYASKTLNDNLIPNAVQHNVPAWAIFAMFFIVIPMGGSIMKEKNEGSVFRLNTMPTPYLLLINGKVSVYVTVCVIQFILMLSVGLHILPLIGLPKLVLGNSYVGILVLTLATAFAATGYAVMVATISSTEHQCAILGSLSILLLSALGGVWVPTYVMPEAMRNISLLSPLNWSLEGFYKLFLRGGGLTDIWWDATKLLLFFLATMAVAHWVNYVKRKV